MISLTSMNTKPYFSFNKLAKFFLPLNFGPKTDILKGI